MNTIKPGYQTTEFWLSTVKLLLSFGLAAGVISAADSSKLEGASAAIITAVFAIVANAIVVRNYIVSRYQLKSQQPDTAEVPVSHRRNSTFPCLLILAGLGLAALAGPVEAQTVRANCFCFGGGSSQPRTDPAVLATLQSLAAGHQQLAAGQQQIIGLLTQLIAKQGSGPAAQTPPTIIMVPQAQVATIQPTAGIPGGGPPTNQIPGGGPPANQIPGGGPPANQIPGGGPPSNQIPGGGAPKNEIPGGGAPKNEIPGGGQPKSNPLNLPPPPPPPPVGTAFQSSRPAVQTSAPRPLAWQPVYQKDHR